MNNYMMNKVISIQSIQNLNLNSILDNKNNLVNSKLKIHLCILNKSQIMFHMICIKVRILNINFPSYNNLISRRMYYFLIWTDFYQCKMCKNLHYLNIQDMDTNKENNNYHQFQIFHIQTCIYTNYFEEND